MTATNIRIMKEISKNKLFGHNLGASVCAQPVRPVAKTGQTGLHGLHGTVITRHRLTGQISSLDRSDRSLPRTKH